MEIDEYTEKHLDKFINEHIRQEDREAFRNYALARAEVAEDPMTVRWGYYYGCFCAAGYEDELTRGEARIKETTWKAEK